MDMILLITDCGRVSEREEWDKAWLASADKYRRQGEELCTWQVCLPQYLNASSKQTEIETVGVSAIT